MRSAYNFYKLFGYDIMLDSDCHPKLIEINARPAALSDKVRLIHLKDSIYIDKARCPPPSSFLPQTYIIIFCLLPIVIFHQNQQMAL